MIVKNLFGNTADGKQVDCYTIRNSSETAVDIITYGATVNSIYVADKTESLPMFLQVLITLTATKTIRIMKV